MKKWILCSVILVLSLVLGTLLCSCSNSEKPPETDPLATNATDATDAPVDKPAVIVYSVKADRMSKYGIELLQKAWKEATGTDIESVKDSDEPTGAPEIIIGTTKRELSTSTEATLQQHDYAIEHKNGSYAVLGLTGYDTYCAVYKFIEDYVKPMKGGELSAKSYRYDYSETYEGDETKYGTLAEIYASIADPYGRVMMSAHRAEHINYPENSIPAIQAAIDLGADMIEIDTRKTKDGYFVLCHDETLARTTNCNIYIGKEGWPTTAKVSDWTLEQIKQLRLEGSDEQMPTFDEVLELARGEVLLVLDKAIMGDTNYSAELYEIAWKARAVETLMFQHSSGESIPDAFYKNIYKETSWRLVHHVYTGHLGFMYEYINDNKEEKDFVISTLQVGFATEAEYETNSVLKQANGVMRLWLNTLNGPTKYEKDTVSAWSAASKLGYSMFQTDSPFELRDFIVQDMIERGETDKVIAKPTNLTIKSGDALPTKIQFYMTVSGTCEVDVRWINAEDSYTAGTYTLKCEAGSKTYDVKVTVE